MARRRVGFPAGLVREIQADPDEPAPYGVLADHLMAAGDRHGELIAVHAALRERPGDRTLERRERAVMKKLAPLGVLAPHASDVAWFMGFVTSLRLDGSKDRSLDALLPTLFELPAARFLRELVLGEPHGSRITDYAACAAALDGAPPTLRRLALGAYDPIYQRVELGRLDGVWSSLPQLEGLRLRGAGESLDLAGIAAPALRDLDIATERCHGAVLVRQIVGGSCPKLERLAIDFGAGSTVQAADLRPILDGALPRLVELDLARIPDGPQLVWALATSKLAARLERLRLRSCQLADGAVRQLAAARLPKLVELDLGANYLSREALDLAATLVTR